MKAVQINGYGGIEVLEINENAPKPTAGKGQVLVEVYAASINPFDRAVRAGNVKDFMPLAFPATLGGDFSGVIEVVGEGVSDFKVGDEIYGQAASYGGGSGSFAEFATASVGKVSAKPKSVDHTKAAAIPLAGASALQALEEHMKLKAGPTSATSDAEAVDVKKALVGKQKILIHGGAGGIGTFAIQIAKSLGAYVASTVSGDDLEYVKGLGADEVIDYHMQDFSEKLSGYDTVFDTVGGEVTNKSFQVLKKGGILVSMVGKPSEELAKKYGVVAIGQNTDGTTEKFGRLADLVDSGKIKVQVDRVFPVELVKEAFTYQETGHPRGKVVLKVR